MNQRRISKSERLGLLAAMLAIAFAAALCVVCISASPAFADDAEDVYEPGMSLQVMAEKSIGSNPSAPDSRRTERDGETMCVLGLQSNEVYNLTGDMDSLTSFYIKPGSTVTINMNGYTIDGSNNDMDAPVFWAGYRCVLNIVGESESSTQAVVYNWENSWWSGRYKTSVAARPDGSSIVNAPIAIRIEDANNVNVSSCYLNGLKSAVWMKTESPYEFTTSYVNLKNCTLANSQEAFCEGALYIRYDGNVRADVTLDNTVICNNRTTGYGAAIHLDGFSSKVHGKNGARIENNWAKKGGAGAYATGLWAANSEKYAHNCHNLWNLTFWNNYTDGHGAGYYADGYANHIWDCSFKNCGASGDGGAIYIDGDNVWVKNCEFNDCVAGDDGGAIAADDQETVYVAWCKITNCRAGDEGGGIWSTAEGTEVADTKLVRCTSGGNGGGAYFDDKRVLVNGCTVKYNTANMYGGGLYFNDSDSSGNINRLYNTTVCYNAVTGSTYGNGVYVDGAILELGGKVIVKENHNSTTLSKEKNMWSWSNLYLDGLSSSIHTKYNGSSLLAEGSEIWLDTPEGRQSDPTNKQVRVTRGEVIGRNVQYFHSDRESFEFKPFDDEECLTFYYWRTDVNDPAIEAPKLVLLDGTELEGGDTPYRYSGKSLETLLVDGDSYRAYDDVQITTKFTRSCWMDSYSYPPGSGYVGPFDDDGYWRMYTWEDFNPITPDGTRLSFTGLKNDRVKTDYELTATVRINERSYTATRTGSIWVEWEDKQYRSVAIQNESGSALAQLGVFQEGEEVTVDVPEECVPYGRTITSLTASYAGISKVIDGFEYNDKSGKLTFKVPTIFYDMPSDAASTADIVLKPTLDAVSYDVTYAVNGADDEQVDGLPASAQCAYEGIVTVQPFNAQVDGVASHSVGFYVNGTLHVTSDAEDVQIVGDTKISYVMLPDGRDTVTVSFEDAKLARALNQFEFNLAPGLTIHEALADRMGSLDYFVSNGAAATKFTDASGATLGYDDPICTDTTIAAVEWTPCAVVTFDAGDSISRYVGFAGKKVRIEKSFAPDEAGKVVTSWAIEETKDGVSNDQLPSVTSACTTEGGANITVRGDVMTLVVPAEGLDVPTEYAVSCTTNSAITEMAGVPEQMEVGDELLLLDANAVFSDVSITPSRAWYDRTSFAWSYSGPDGDKKLSYKDGKDLVFSPRETGAYTLEVKVDNALGVGSDYVQSWVIDVVAASEYTVTFDSQGNLPSGYSASSVEPQTLLKHSRVSEPVIEKEIVGDSTYVFDGWYLNGQKYNFANTITSDIELKAQWTRVYYIYTSVTEPGHGKITDEFTVKEGEDATIVATPEYGWAVEAWADNGEVFAGSTGQVYTIKNVSSNHTVKVQFTSNSHWVDFSSIGNLPEGVSAPYVRGQSVANGQTAVEPTPVKSGFVFVKWQLRDGQTFTDYDFNTPVTRDIELVAVWAQLYSLTVTASDGGSVSSDDKAFAGGTYVAGTSVELVAKPDSGYEFAGWYTADGTTKVEESAVYTVVMDEANTNLSAKFVPIGESVSEEENLVPVAAVTVPTEAGEVSGVGMVQAGSHVTLTAPAAEGYSFVGWYDNTTNELLSTGRTLQVVVAADEPVAVSAVFFKPTVTFDSDNGDAILNVPVAYGSSVEQLDNPTRDGYEFTGWTLNGRAYDFSSPVTEDIVLVAKWMQTTAFGYKISAQVIGQGSVSGVGTLEEGEAVVLKAKPADGWVFQNWQWGDNWDRKVSSANPYTFAVEAEDINFTATFVQPVTGIEMTSAASVKPGETVELAGTALSDNPTAWSGAVKWTYLSGPNAGMEADGSEGLWLKSITAGDEPGTIMVRATVVGGLGNEDYTQDFAIEVTDKVYNEVTFVSDDVSLVRRVETGSAISNVPSPSKDGYELVSWQSDGITFDMATPVVSDLTLVAEWIDIATADQQKAELAKAKQMAIEELSSTYAPSKYSGEDRAAVEKALAEATAAIEAASNIAAVEAAKSAAVATLATYKTDEEKAAEQETVTKKTNPMKVTPKKVKATAAKLKKKAVKVKAPKAFKVTDPEGKVTYKRGAIKCKKKLTKQAKKKIKIAKSGKITLKRGLKKGTYKVKVKVTAAGNARYKKITKTVTLRIVVR